MLQRPRARGAVGLQLQLHRLVVRLRDPALQDDGVVGVAQRAHQGGGGVGGVVGQGELGHKLPQQGSEAS